mmetsp:Transcript_114837/g.364989  ORF Transcript_114837/g.364989 Transcript_114837/m.364989 type:complete len:403 (+) Transcript_114837:441-1649(+)
MEGRHEEEGVVDGHRVGRDDHNRHTRQGLQGLPSAARLVAIGWQPLKLNQTATAEPPIVGKHQCVIDTVAEQAQLLQISYCAITRSQKSLGFLAQLRAIDGDCVVRLPFLVRVRILVERQNCADGVKPRLLRSEKDAEDRPVQLLLAPPRGDLLLVAAEDLLLRLLPLLEALLLAAEDGREDSMHHNIRVPSDWRREVRVVIKIQREVVSVCLVVVDEVRGLLHACPHGHHLNAQAQHFSVLPVDGLARAIDRPRVAGLPLSEPQVLLHHLREHLCFRWVRSRVVPQHRHVRENAVRHMFCHALVGEQHQLLDDPMRCGMMLEVITGGNAVLALPRVEDHLLLGDREGPTLEAAAAHLAADVIQEENVFFDLLPSVPCIHSGLIDLFAIQHILNLIIVQAAN